MTVSQLADDTCLFLKNKDQVPVILEALKLFSDASGLSVNQSKSEIMAIHQLEDSCISGIQVKQIVRYLSIVISKSASERITENFSQRLQKTRNIFNCWLQRNVSIQGRVLISKAEGTSRLVYPALSLYVDSKMCAAVDKILFKFIWRGKTDYIKRKTIIRSLSEGGLNALDFDTINNIFKINWIKHCLCDNNFPWFFIPNCGMWWS